MEKFVQDFDSHFNDKCKEYVSDVIKINQKHNLEISEISVNLSTLEGLEEFYKKYDLNMDITPHLHFSTIDGFRMQWYYKGNKLYPQGHYILPSPYREPELLEILKECIKQDTHSPDIKELQLVE